MEVIRAALLSALVACVSATVLSSCATSDSVRWGSVEPVPWQTRDETQLLRWVDQAGEGAIELTDLSSNVDPDIAKQAERSARRLLTRGEALERGTELGYVGTGVLTVDTTPPIDEEDVVVVTLASPKTDRRPAMSFVVFLSADGRRLVFQFSRAPGTVGEPEVESKD